MLDDGAQRHVAEALARQRVAFDERLKNGRHHVLIRAAGVGRMRAAKRYANAADDGDPTSLQDAHAHSARLLGTQYKGAFARRGNGTASCFCEDLHSTIGRMKTLSVAA